MTTNVQEPPVDVNNGSGIPQNVNNGGPRIVINPQVFNDKRDALCVAFNEALRIIMEENGFEPQAEPTEAQRQFFADTAYADDELQLRRTILARTCVFDTSVKAPTDEQLQEAVEFLESVMEIGAPQNEWEQSIIQRSHDIIAKLLQPKPPVAEGPTPGATQEPPGAQELKPDSSAAYTRAEETPEPPPSSAPTETASE